MDFEMLAELLSDWYEVTPDRFEQNDENFRTTLHPVLSEFYRRFGKLTEEKSEFTLSMPVGWAPFAAQDILFPLKRVTSEAEYFHFLAENQGVFSVAAKGGSQNIWAKGDLIDESYVENFKEVPVKICDFLICTALRETIFSSQFIHKKIPHDTLEDEIESAKSGRSISIPYLWPNFPMVFWISQDIWAIDIGGTFFTTKRGDWRR